MKKYVMFSLVLVVLSTAFTSCHKTDAYDPDRPEEDARKLYDRNFLAYVGGSINEHVDWGFGRTTANARAKTRAEAPRVYLDESGEGYSTEFSKNFFSTVMEYFPEGKVCKSDKWINYEFVENAPFHNVRLIYSNTLSADEVGLYYYDPASETYEDSQEITLIENIQNGVSDYFQFNQYDEEGEWLDPHPAWGYSIWTVSGTKRIHCKTFTIYMKETYHFGFYVRNNGKTYYTNMYKNEDEASHSALIGDEAVGNIPQSYVFGLSDDGQPGYELLFAMIKAGRGEPEHYPTLIRPEKIVPPEPPTPPALEWYRIIAEDLNAHDVDHDGDQDDTDFDFNDVVLDVALTETGAKCILQAAGATLKIRINGDIKLEVHDMFGVDQGVMVNTHAEKRGLAHADKDPVEFDLEGSFSSIDEITLEVYKKVGSEWKWLELTAPEGRPSCKIAVKKDFVWPDERESLKEKYPNFLNYVKNYQDVEDWWRSMNP